MADRWIELFDVETDKAELLFVFDRFEPVDYGCGVFPLVEVVFFRDCAVDAVEDVFADFAYLGLRGVDESAGRFVCEVRLVILKCYECVFVGCTLLFSRSRFNSKKGVKRKGTKRLHFWSKIHSGIAYSVFGVKCTPISFTPLLA